MPMIIDDKHEKIIKVTMWLLDEMLCKFENWIAKRQINSLLYEEVNLLQEDEGQRIINEINAIRPILNEIKNKFGFKKHYVNVGQSIHVSSLLCITDSLNPLKSKNLSDYGKVSAELAAYLDPKIDQLIEILERVVAVGEVVAKRFSESSEPNHLE